ncbi:lipoprotein-releasing ABC transporter ATP-binding protein LolD [Buchnera aphidicola]|uniref:Lipoprotein-releasing system ATP-binding protein LolD n=1 Tax=Buchnera aphidicola subsp. Rhopalosiphum maidis TaxID=118109 RepID=A0A3G2I5T0_BUCRM|nr:lipoprotein-releasing ABC transporter ATP-binding protein LolD [Buchnera aphidicola]AYN24770.1 lipoprotein-releasing ABC transporter ATP-binding protein LolD [Buchnera aphidicola (Rhopalosiphum maidis)]
MNKNIILQCANLTKSFYKKKEEIKILSNISLKVHRGDIIFITGKSGSGKSTFLHLLSGLDNPTSGRILFDGILLSSMSSNEIAKLRNLKLGFIFQFHHLLLDFNVLENVSIPSLISKKSTKESKEKSYEILKRVHLEKKVNKYPSELSGGERQRVAIARALVNQPSLVIADEPTSNLDKNNEKIIFDLIFELNSTLNTSFLIVSHNLSFIKKQHILFEMKHGQLFNNKNQYKKTH